MDPVGPPAPKAERPPKRALTSYMVFVKETRPDMVKNNPEMTVREIVSTLAKQWREMDEESKKPYETVAVADKQRADEERAAWVAAGKEIPKRRKKQKRKHKKNKHNNDKKVKRVSSAYIFFSVDQRPTIAMENPGWQMGDVSKELGRRWREMSDDDKAPYVAKHEEDKERHRLETEREQEAQRIEQEKQQAQHQRDLEEAQAQQANHQQALQQLAMQQQAAIQQQQLQQMQNMPQHAQQAAIQQQLQMQMQQFQQAQLAQMQQMQMMQHQNK